MYDAELFGHWWFEGPDFIENFLRIIYCDQNVYSTITPTEYLNFDNNIQLCKPADSYWSDKGYNEVRLNGKNDWVYRNLHKITSLMIDYATKYKKIYHTFSEKNIKSNGKESFISSI